MTLRVAAAGTGPLAYSWQFNGADIYDNARISGSASSTLGITAVTEADGGAYRVIVSNAKGPTNSQAVTLIVKPDQPFHPANASTKN